MKFVLASSNKHKLIEFQRMVKHLDIEIITKENLGINKFDVDENELTFEGNAKLKAIAMYKISGLPSIADDSGLIVDALNGEPGVFSSRYAGINASDKDKYELVLTKLKDVPEIDRNARFASSIYCILNERDFISVTGYCEGRISFAPKGKNGFGYDPIFLPKKFDYKKSFAQLTDEEKDSISHRHEAMRMFLNELDKII